MHVGDFNQTVTPPANCSALPSGTSAVRLLEGDPRGLFGVVGHTLGRATLIGVGMAIAGERKHLVRNAVGGALAIEGFVLVWAAWQVHNRPAAPPAPAPP